MEDEERTTVDQEPPANLRARWEEKTVAEKTTGDGRASFADDDSGELLVDTGVTRDEFGRPRVASGTAERTGSATIDEPARDENQAKPLVPGATGPHVPRMPSGVQFMQRAPSAAHYHDNKLVVVSGSDKGREFSLEDRLTTVGRGVENDIILTDISVSRKHLRIEQEENGFWLVDLESGNGTLVNDEEVEARYQLINGDRMELGNTVIRIDCPAYNSQRSAAAAVARQLEPVTDDSFDEEASTIAGKQPPRPPPGELPITDRGARRPRNPPGPMATDPSKLILPAAPPGATIPAQQSPAIGKGLPPGPGPGPGVPGRMTIQHPGPPPPTQMPQSEHTPSVIQTLSARPIESSPQMPTYPPAPQGFGQHPPAQPYRPRSQPLGPQGVPHGVLPPQANQLDRKTLIKNSAIVCGGLFVFVLLSWLIFAGGDNEVADSSGSDAVESTAADTPSTDTEDAVLVDDDGNPVEDGAKDKDKSNDGGKDKDKSNDGGKDKDKDKDNDGGKDKDKDKDNDGGKDKDKDKTENTPPTTVVAEDGNKDKDKSNDKDETDKTPPTVASNDGDKDKTDGDATAEQAPIEITPPPPAPPPKKLSEMFAAKAAPTGTWGTEETFLASLEDTKPEIPQINPLPDDTKTTNDGTTTGGGDDAKSKDNGDSAGTKKSSGAGKLSRREQRRREREKDRERRREREKDRERRAREAAARNKSSGGNKDRVNDAVQSAQANYRKRRFRQAATILRNATSYADASDRKKLKLRANRLDQLQNAVIKAENTKSTNKLNSWLAWKKARGLDNTLGKKHVGYFSQRIAELSKVAAYTYMARKDWRRAASAAREAQRAGNNMSKMRDDLEARARKLLRGAEGLAKSKDPKKRTQAARDAKLAKDIAKQNSPLKSRADKLLAKLK